MSVWNCATCSYLILLTLYFAVGHSIRCTQDNQSDPYRCQTRQYYGGESLDQSHQSQADRLRLGHPCNSNQDGHEIADSFLQVRSIEILIIIILEWVCSLAVLLLVAVCFLPILVVYLVYPCARLYFNTWNMTMFLILCNAFLPHSGLRKSFWAFRFRRPSICGPWEVCWLPWSWAIYCFLEKMNMKQ